MSSQSLVASNTNISAQQYYGQSIAENLSQLNDQERRQQKTGISGNKMGTTSAEDQFNKKQIEFKGGKVHQLITD